MELIDGKTVTDQELMERGLLHWDRPSESCAVRHLHTGASCPNAETAPAWMVEEEEALIRLEQDVESAIGAHRAHCPQCGPHKHAENPCRALVSMLIMLDFIGSAREANQQRQDEATPLPEFSPVKA